MASDPAVVDGRVASTGAAGRPSWLALRAEHDPSARRRRGSSRPPLCSAFPFDAYEISLVASELVTNAIVGAARAGEAAVGSGSP